jgi:hypothetical protein
MTLVAAARSLPRVSVLSRVLIIIEFHTNRLVSYRADDLCQGLLRSPRPENVGNTRCKLR